MYITRFSCSPSLLGSHFELSRSAIQKQIEKPPPRPPKPGSVSSQYPHSYAFGAKRRMFDKGPDVSIVCHYFCDLKGKRKDWCEKILSCISNNRNEILRVDIFFKLVTRAADER